MYNNGTISVNAPDYTNEAKTSDVPAISRQLTLVQKLLAEHREVQEMLGRRLHAVLKPSPPQATEAVPFNAPRPTTSPMVDDLEGFAATLQQTLAVYHDMLNRLEL